MCMASLEPGHDRPSRPSPHTAPAAKPRRRPNGRFVRTGQEARNPHDHGQKVIPVSISRYVTPADPDTR